MKNKGMWILTALTAVAVSAAVFDFQWTKVKEESKSNAALVFGVKPENVHEFTLVFTDPAKIVKDGVPIVTNKTTLAFEGGQWMIKSPIDEPADQENARTFVEQLSGEKSQEVGGQKDKIDWAEFGLDSPKGSIAVKDTNGKVIEISVGRRNFQNESYLRRNQENKVLLGGASWYPKLDKPFFEFRDKRPIRFAEELKRVQIKTPIETFEFVNRDTKWSLVSKPKWKLDQNKVREVLGKLTGNSLSGIVAEGKLNPSATQPFQKAAIEFTADLKDKKWSAKLIETKALDGEGQSKDLKSYLLWIQEPSMIATMAQFDAEKFFRMTLDEFRDRQAPFDFRKAEVQRIEIRSAKSRVELEKKEDAWKIITQSDPKLGVDASKIASFVDRLSELEAMEFQTKPAGVLAGERMISVKDANGKTLLDLALSEAHKRKVNGVDRAIVTAKSSLIDETLSIDENKVKTLGLDEMLSPKQEKPAVDPPEQDGSK